LKQLGQRETIDQGMADGDIEDQMVTPILFFPEFVPANAGDRKIVMIARRRRMTSWPTISSCGNACGIDDIGAYQ
jgi:hypothetical protein